MNTKAFIYLGYAMSVVYCLAGIAIVLYGEGIFDLPGWARVATGSLLIVYGVFRFIRSRNMSKQV